VRKICEQCQYCSRSDVPINWSSVTSDNIVTLDSLASSFDDRSLTAAVRDQRIKYWHAPLNNRISRGRRTQSRSFLFLCSGSHSETAMRLERTTLIWFEPSHCSWRTCRITSYSYAYKGPAKKWKKYRPTQATHTFLSRQQVECKQNFLL